ncbi:MAG: Gfo/Idh/MocA family oxidoreductase [Planctomycetes bacterium]|nr:Gfo/Idh/MocA family oxidoreductase [Planctomycetota bacterium]
MIRVSRRHFLAAGLAGAAALSFPSFLRFPRGDKLRLGVIGVGNRGADNLAGVEHEHIAALCDVDANFLNGAAKRHPDAKLYRDWRHMLAEQKLDGVVISTPDHTHAAPTLWALRRKIPVYLEKPLTHTVAECRAVMAAAAVAAVATQMGTQIHAGENYHAVVDLLRAGAIGKITRVTAWVGTDWSATGTPAASSVPANLNYDLWLGPEAEVPFSAAYHPAAWRRYWHFGGGGLADMACHWLDLAWWALELGSPHSISAAGPLPDAAGAPAWTRCEWRVHGRESEVTVLWHGGSDRPTPRLRAISCDDFDNGILFEGDKGMLVADYGRYRVLPEAVSKNIVIPAPHVPRSPGHHKEWLEAIRTGAVTSCPFSYSGKLTEAVLLANVAFRTQRTLAWDAVAGRCRDDDEANALLSRPVRSGWRE